MDSDQPDHADPDGTSVADDDGLQSQRTEELNGDAVSGVSTEDGAPTPTGTVPPAALPDDDQETPNEPLSERLY